MGISIPVNFEQDIRDLGPICYLCIVEKTEESLQGKELRVNCTKCDRPYCNNHSSGTDPQFCRDCCRDFQAIQTTQFKCGVQEMIVIDPSGQKEDTVVRLPYKEKYKQIRLLGTDWLFYETSIAAMTDNQLEAALQWHKAAVSEIEIEVTERKIKKAQALAKLPTPKVTNISRKQPDQQKLMNKATNMLETFKATFGADVLAQALELLKKKGT